jgi:hypothetical protein
MAGSRRGRWQQAQVAEAISQLIYDLESVKGCYMTQCLRQAQAAPATAEEWERAAADGEAALNELASRAKVLFNVCCRE